MFRSYLSKSIARASQSFNC